MFGQDDSQQTQSQNNFGAPSQSFGGNGQPPADNTVTMPSGAPSVPGSDYNPPSNTSEFSGNNLPQAQPQAVPMPSASVPSDNQMPSPQPFSPPPANNSVNNDELLDIKQQALQHLSPLVTHLDQTPEEKFRTTMMMIQASDDQSLIKSAFEAAQSITDDKVRAQALLDVINEINYFNQHHNQ